MKIIAESVNISEIKGTVKHAVDEIIVDKTGIINDAHAGNWHRQLSMLSSESIAAFSKLAGRKIQYGEFAENITLNGMNLKDTAPLDRFRFNEVLLELTQIGKKCHGDSCAIYREVGNCIMPKEGIFCRVLKGGRIKAGDQGEYIPKVYNIHVIVLSDRASSGVYEDKSGKLIVQKLNDFFKDKSLRFSISDSLIADDAVLLEKLIREKSDTHDIIFTTGGTGIGPRDFTPDVIKPLLHKEIPGIMEMIRVKYGMQKPNALLSRSIAGVRDNALIFALPGSVKAVDEYMNEILAGLQHMIYMLHQIDNH